MKKKIVSICLVVALAATAIVGGTLAYFTDTDEAVNVFTAGDVKIDLTEGKVEKDDDGNLVFTDQEKDRQDVLTNEEDEYKYGNLYPAMTVDKDPTIENLGSETAYLAAKVTITSDGNLNTYENAEGEEVLLLGVAGYENIDISGIVSGGLASETVAQNFEYNGLSMVYNNDNYAVYQEADKAKNTYVLYFFIEEAKETNEKVVLFEKLSIPAEWNNDEMAQLDGLKIAIEAFAVQEYGFDTCFEAMTTAFAEEFNFD